MKLLMTRLAGGLLGRSSSGSGKINRKRRCFIDLVPSRRHTTVTRQTWEIEPPVEGSPTPAVADHPRWMVLNRSACRSDDDITAANVVPDDKTTAECRTTWGRPLRVSLGRAAPPGISSIFFNRDDACYPLNDENRNDEDSDDERLPAHYYDDDTLNVVAAHGDSVILKMSVPYKLRRHLAQGRRSRLPAATSDYFLYRTAGAAATGQPPSLSLLPACQIPMAKHHNEGEGEGKPDDFVYADRVFRDMDTGLLHGSGDGDDDSEVLVCQLRVSHKAPFDTAELCLLRTGRRRRGEWELKGAVPIVHHKGGARHGLGRWLKLNDAFPAGNRFLCWVNHDSSTLLVCDMAEVENNPKLRYVPLPVKPLPLSPKEFDEWPDEDRVKEPLPWPWEFYRGIGAATATEAAAAPVVRFTSIDYHCRCCGAPLCASVYDHRHSTFEVTTWTMALNTTGAPMDWVKGDVLDCGEIWEALGEAGYGDMPRVDVNCPIVSPENPNVVCFLAEDMDREMNGNEESWTLEFDMRKNTVLSVVSCCDRTIHPIQWDVRGQDKPCAELPALPTD